MAVYCCDCSLPVQIPSAKITHTHTHPHAPICTHAFAHTHPHTPIRTHPSSCTHPHTPIRTHPSTHTHPHAPIRTHTLTGKPVQNGQVLFESDEEVEERREEEDEEKEMPKLLVMDLRSYTAALGNRAKGGGCECQGEMVCSVLGSSK